MRGPGGGQELRSPVHDGRYGLPDIGVSTRQYEGPYIWSGPAGPSRPRSSARETFEEALKSRGTCG
jgi:hypothetical protein